MAPETTSSNKENTRRLKPIPRKNIRKYDLNSSHVAGVSKGYFKVSITQWNNARCYIQTIDDAHIIKCTHLQVLKHIRDSLESISNSQMVPRPVSVFASKCHAYTLSPRFSSTFEKLYEAKKKRVIEANSKSACTSLRIKAINNAAAITSMAMDKVKDTTLRDLSQTSDTDDNDSNDNPHSELAESYHSINYHPRRKQAYLFTNICRNYKYDEASPWMVNGCNASRELSLFGQLSLSLHDKKDHLSDIRLLSLDHIYSFSVSLPSSVTKYFGFSLHQAVMKGLIPKTSVSPSQELTTACTNVSLVPIHADWIDIMNLGADIIAQTRTLTHEDVLFGSIIYKTLTDVLAATATKKNEDTFVHNCLHNIFSMIFTFDRFFSCEWANSTLQSHKTYKPDWIASIKPWTTTYNVIAGEAKTKEMQNRGVVSDFVKLGRQMKLMLEEIVLSGAKEPKSFGMLIKGPSMELYSMDLKADGVYRLVNLDTLQLATSLSEMNVMSRSLPLLFKFKEDALNVARQIEMAQLAKARGTSIDPTIPLKWFRKSADSKLKSVQV